MRKIFFILIPIIVLGITIFYIGIKYIIPLGSYPYGQTYEFNITTDQLIDTIENFKKNNPKFTSPIGYLHDGIHDSVNHDFAAYFYDKNSNLLFLSIIQMDNNKSSLILFSINSGLTNGHWKCINRDFSSPENKRIKQIFENQVLKIIGIKYIDKGNSMSFLGFQI